MERPAKRLLNFSLDKYKKTDIMSEMDYIKGIKYVRKIHS